MKNKKIWIALLALLIAGGAVGATLAFFTDAKEQKNVFVMGNIGISLAEPEFAKSTDGTYKINDFLPNQRIVKDPQITVNEDSLDVYLRASITYEGLNEEQAAQLEDTIQWSGGWYKGGDGLYYYNRLATKNDVVPIFTSVVIPWQWGNGMLDNSFKIIVGAEAIQADYFTPETIVLDDETMISSWRNKDGSTVIVK